MSVCVLVQSQGENESLCRWGVKFARAMEQPLLVVQAPGVRGEGWDKPAFLDTISNGVPDTLPEIEFMALPADKQLSWLEGLVETRDIQLLISCKHQSSRTQEKSSVLARQLFEKMPCHTLLMRLSESAVCRIERILLPVAGGPHSISALKFLAQFAESAQAELVPMLVVPDADPLSREVGELTMQKLLQKARLDEAPFVNPKVVLADDVTKTIGEESVAGAYDLVITGATNVGALRQLLFETVPERLLKGDNACAVAVFRSKRPVLRRAFDMMRSLYTRVIPQLVREERVDLVERMHSQSRWNFDFFALICLSTAIASLGLMQNSTAVVIGAMLVAPLMVPLIGAGLAINQGNLPLMRVCTKSMVYGYLMALFIGILAGWIVPMRGMTHELLSRGIPTPLDMGVAFVSGLAAAYCVSRPNLSAALPGVAISAALVPPIATTGIALATGDSQTARGSSLLFATNVVCVSLGAAISLALCGAHGERGANRVGNWVKTTLACLLLSCGILLIPLASMLVSQLSGQGPAAAKASESLQAAIELKLAEDKGITLESSHLVRQPGRVFLELRIVSDHQPDKRMVDDLAEMASERIGEPVKVRVYTQLLMESAPVGTSSD